MSVPLKIPFNRASLAGKEIEYVLEAVRNGHVSGDGPFTRRCSEFLEQRLGVGRALLTTSCTHALEMSAFLLDIKPGDEVIMPSFTFVSTANAFLIRGAKPVFVDIRRDTLNLDERLIEERITDRTRAIVPVHYAGVGCAMDEIGRIASEHGLTVIEDNAHGMMGKYRGRMLGSFGALATLSFHETKNFTCGEGGALLVNDPSLVERAEIIREKGTNRSRFFRGEVDKYTWVDEGSSYLPSDMLAAFALAQFECAEAVQSARRRVWERYAARLGEWAEPAGVGLPHVPEECEQAYHMFYLICPSGEARDSLIAHLRSVGILSVFHYLPLHVSPMGQSLGGCEGDCPVTEDMADRLVRLPFYNTLGDAEIDEVCVAVMEAARQWGG